MRDADDGDPSIRGVDPENNPVSTTTNAEQVG
jgi:hypothetical protein